MLGQFSLKEIISSTQKWKVQPDSFHKLRISPVHMYFRVIIMKRIERTCMNKIARF